jgi:Icc-related predicted phosphoesterase
MQLVLISDTHGYHHDLKLPSGDVLLHTGDVSRRGRESEVVDFLTWFAKQNYTYKIFIAGNHDFFFEQESPEKVAAMIPEGVIYLNDSGVTIEGIQFWGSPVQPRFFDWAFNRDRGADINRHWQLIPPDVDVLLTHGPPHGILDRTTDGQEVGCEMLLKRVGEVKPQLAVFGHIHEGYGMVEKDGVVYVNASVLDVRYRLVNEAVVFSLSGI